MVAYLSQGIARACAAKVSPAGISSKFAANLPLTVRGYRTVSEEAKAAQEIAKAAGKALDGFGQLGEFLGRVFGDLVEDGVGVVTDKVRYYRVERTLLLRDKVEKRLKDKGISATVPVPPRIGVRLIEEAAVSDTDELHTRWANLLANAMDPSFKGKVKRNYVSILSDIEPIDAQILDVVIKEYQSISEADRDKSLFDRSKLVVNLGSTHDDCEVSLRNLMRLGLIKPGVVTGGISIGDHSVGSYKDTEMFAPTLLGIEFHAAVQ